MQKIIIVLSGICLLLLAGCASLLIDSTPKGGRIIIDDNLTGFTTPHRFKLKDLNSQDIHSVIVLAEGHKAPIPQQVELKVSGFRIVSSILLPVPFLVIYAIDGFKVPSPKHVNFNLETPLK